MAHVASLTEFFAFFFLSNPCIGNFNVVRKRRSVEFEALEL